MRKRNIHFIPVETFPVPYSLVETIDKITFTTNSEPIPSKEEIINQAFKFHGEGNISEAVKYYEYCIYKGFKNSNVYSNYGVIQKGFGKFKEAELSLRKAIELNPDSADHHSNLGNILNNLGKFKEAELSLRKAIELNPEFASAYSNLGNILNNLGKFKEAELSLRKAIELDPTFAIAYSNLGNIFFDLGNLKEAELYLRKAIELKPDYAIGYSNLGAILRDLGNLKEAELYLRKAIELKPDYAVAYSNLGSIYKDKEQFIDAIKFYKKSLKLDGNLSSAKFGLITSRGVICDWSHQEEQKALLEKIGIEGKPLNTLSLICLEDDPSKQLKRAKNLYKQKYQKKFKPIASFKNNKIHVGYFSADFRAHPMMYLMGCMFKLHDKNKFQIYLYSFVTKEDKYTQLAKESGCIFRDIKELSDIEAVELARNDQLDIAIDRMGYVRGNRMNIFSYKVAPIQIHYLAYPGSLGSDAIEYLIADKIIIPKESEKYYSEKIIRMPNSYQCNDNKKEICKEYISRKDCNLPDNAFVFTCFCANKKITPNEFDIWMRLLKRINGSVLWLYKSNEFSVKSLINEAKKRNVEPDRLIFANKLPLKKHLARHVHGDLGLDTFSYNGHTTTSDALWAGLPVITKIGEGFAARVSASMLNAIGLPELITSNEKEYEDTAFQLANNPDQLIRLKSKLWKSREKSSLYDSELFTRDLERKFIELVKNQ